MLTRLLLSLLAAGYFASTTLVEPVAAKASGSIAITKKKSSTEKKARTHRSKTWAAKSRANRKQKKYTAKTVNTARKSAKLLGIRNLRLAKEHGRMSTAADTRKSTVRNFGTRVSYKYRPGTIVVSNYTRRLYYVVQPGKVLSYPIATPRPNEIWTGSTKISEKKVNPDWYPTPDMREKNPSLPEKVTGGSRDNPLGPRALYLGNSLYRIHGTNNPRSIGNAASAGCYRMHNKHIKSLFRRVQVGTPVVVTNSRRI